METTNLDCLDTATLEQRLGSVPRQGDSNVNIVRIIPPQIRHQLGLHVELNLVPEDVGHDAPHHEDREEQGGHCEVDHQQALHLLVAAVEAKQAVCHTEQSSNYLQYNVSLIKSVQILS